MEEQLKRDLQDRVVKDALVDFLDKSSAQVTVSAIDEIVLNYVASILEDMGSEYAVNEVFDVDNFTEMMEAYVPGFSTINSTEICQWMFGLAEHVKKVKRGEDSGEGKKNDLSYMIRQQCSPSQKKESPPAYSSRESKHHKQTKSSEESFVLASHRNRCTIQQSEELHDETINHGSEVLAKCSSPCEEQLHLLTEMFPLACTVELTHCLGISNGNVDKAAQLLLYRQESGESLKVPRQNQVKHSNQQNEKTLRQAIVDKYAYVNVDDDKKDYKPMVPKSEPKKLVRYLDSKIVSTKGDRFTEVKQDDDKDLKKTYVNLKPAKQYHFH